MAMTRSNFASLMAEGLREVFFEWLDLKSMVYPQVYDIQKSTQQKETDQSIAGIGMLSEKDEGTSIDYDSMVEGYETNYVHTTYARGIRITEELLEDCKYGIMNKRSKALANATRYRMEYDHASLFNNATGTSVFTGGDGYALLKDGHTLSAQPGITLNNYATSTLSLSALETAFTYFGDMVDDQNMLVGIEPAILLIPNELQFDAYEILKSSGKPYTADNENNFFQGRLKVIVWDFLTDADAWFILAGKRYGAPISFNRVPVSFGRDGDFDTGDLKMKARVRYSFGFSDWRWCYGSVP